MSEMNHAIETWTPEQFQPVTMTPAAISHFEKMLLQHPAAISMLIGITKSGCTGYKYTIDYVHEIPAEAYAFTVKDGLSIYVSLAAMPLLQGAEIDYGWHGINKSYIFNNPNEKHKCGCGESFSV